MQRCIVQFSGDAQKGAHAAFGVGRDQDQTTSRLPIAGPSVVKVGVDTTGLQIFDIKITQVIVRHFARIEGLAAELRQGDDGIARRAAASLPGGDGFDVLKQLGSARRVNEGHVSLIDSHGFELSVADFVFRINQSVANGIKIVVRHGCLGR